VTAATTYVSKQVKQNEGWNDVLINPMLAQLQKTKQIEQEANKGKKRSM